MELTIKALKDASQAADKLVDAFAKLGSHLVEGMKEGVGFYDAYKERDVLDRLNDLSVTLTFLTARQRANFIPVIKLYIKQPTLENWNTIKSNIEKTIEICTRVLDNIEQTRRAIATKEFFAKLVDLILERDKTLKDLLGMPRPESKAAIEELRAHLTHYIALLKQLDATNRALKKFLDHQAPDVAKAPKRGSASH